MPKGKGRQRKRIRKRDWDAEADQDAAVREPRKLRGRESGIGAPVSRPSDDAVPAAFDAASPNAVVVSPYGVLAFVESDGRQFLCRVADELTDGKTSFLAPGDAVEVAQLEGEWFVVAVAPRRNKLGRPSLAGRSERVIAANIDLLVVVASTARPRFVAGFVDRFLIAAEASGVEAMLCLNKVDLAAPPDEATSEYSRLGVDLVLTSCETGEGLDALRARLSGKMAVLAGQSGVGKSSLLNALSPELEVVVGEVSEATDKGRHTTTTSRLYRIPPDIRIIDTPGVRQLGVWGVTPEELAYYFPEIARFGAECRFRDCSHTHEPDCAVRAQVAAGGISERRYRSYLHILRDIAESSRR